MEGNVLQILDHLGTQGGALSTWAQFFYMSNGHNLPTSADSCLRCYVKAPIQSGVSHRLSRAVPLSSLLHYIGTTYLSRLPSSLKSGGNVWPLFPWRKLCELQRQWLDSPSPLSPASAEWACRKAELSQEPTLLWSMVPSSMDTLLVWSQFSVTLKLWRNKIPVWFHPHLFPEIPSEVHGLTAHPGLKKGVFWVIL